MKIGQGRMKFKFISINLALMIFLCSCSHSKSAAFSDKDKLFLIKESEHGMFYSQSKEEKTSEVVEELALHFETNYDRITKLFMYTPSQKTIIHIYTEKEQFYKIIGRVTEGTYDASDGIIKVFTPPSLIDPDVNSEFKFQLIHEFIHSIIQQINPKVGQVKWLDEGTAYFASLQLEAELNHRSKFLNIPTLEQVKSPTFFDDFGGSAYFYSGLIVKFISKEYGIHSLNEIIRKPENIEIILNKSIENLYLDWKASLQ